MRPGRLCAHRGAQTSSPALELSLGRPDRPLWTVLLAVANGFALRLGELAVAVALHRLRRHCDEARMGLHAFSPAPRRHRPESQEFALRLRLKRRGFAGLARLRLAPMELRLLDLARTLASAVWLAPFIASSWRSTTASAARLAMGSESQKSR